MKLSKATLDVLAELICGAAGHGGFAWQNFPYRSSSYLTAFFRKCDLPYQHDGFTRKYWVYDVLEEVNEKISAESSLPSPEMCAVIKQLADPLEYQREGLDYDAAMQTLNRVLGREGLQTRFINGQPTIENLRTHVSTRDDATGRLLSREEIARRQEFVTFLERASEDEFTEEILVSLFRKLGFQRVTVTGHTDRSLEFGKDVWMKYQLPTGHQLYVGVQVKKGRIHAAGKEVTSNISGILSQLLMLTSYPVFDSETNTKHLIDHVFLVSSGEITKQARQLLTDFLDNTMRRNVLFLDRDEILDLCIQYGLPVPDMSVGNDSFE